MSLAAGFSCPVSSGMMGKMSYWEFLRISRGVWRDSAFVNP